jgi:UPF0755 protein
MRRVLAALLALAVLAGGWSLFGGWYGRGPLKHDGDIIIPEGATLAVAATRLEAKGAVVSARLFRLRARLFGHGRKVKAGEFALPLGASESQVFAIVTSDDALRRFVTIPEGMPSIEVQARLAAAPALTGAAPIPPEGSVLPQTYDYKREAPRAEVLAQMQAAMTKVLDQLWAKRAPDLPVHTAREALILASIVEKETGKPSERAMVAGLYENRLRKGIMLQADPTIIYPITKGRPLGRRIKQSEISAVNDYNTYAMSGLPKGPITNPGKAAIEAVLHPAQTDALYMVADGTGGHAFAATLEEHNQNVQKWFAIRHARGEL